MFALETALCVALIVMAVILVVAVLLQPGSEEGLSGSISGSSADTYYGKSKAGTRERILSKITLVVSIIFTLVVIATYIVVSVNGVAAIPTK